VDGVGATEAVAACAEDAGPDPAVAPEGWLRSCQSRCLLLVMPHATSASDAAPQAGEQDRVEPPLAAAG